MKDSEPEKRILFCRLGGIGDVVHTLPLVKFLRKNFPSSRIEYVTSEGTAGLLEDFCPFIDHVWVFNKRNKKKLISNLFSENHRQIDYFFNLHTSYSFFFFNLLFIRAKKFFQYKKDNNVHAVVNFARTYDSHTSALSLDSKTLFDNDENEILEKSRLKEGKYFCLVPGVGKVRAHRAWPLEYWQSLAKKILYHENNFKVVLLGGEEELRLLENYRESSELVVNLIGKLNLSETAKIISKSNMLISGDTGLLHIAAGLSVRVIGLYGPTRAERSGPFSRNYHVLKAKNCECNSGIADIKRCKKSDNGAGYCMNNLSVNEVMSTLFSCDLVSN